MSTCTVELILLVGRWGTDGARLEGVRAGELSPQPCGSKGEERCPSSFIPCHLQGSWHCLSPAVAYGRIGLAPRLSSTLELTLAAPGTAGQVSQTCGHESSRAEPAPSLYATPWLFPPTPCQLWQAGEPVARDVRIDKLALSPTNCSNWKSVLYTSPGPRWFECGRASPKKVLRVELSLLLAACCAGWVSWEVLWRATLLVTKRESWWADQRSYCPGSEPGLWVGLSNIHLISEWLEYVKRLVPTPADPMPKDNHDTGQQNIREESQWGPSMDWVAETRGLKPEQNIPIVKNTSKDVWTTGCTVWLTGPY